MGLLLLAMRLIRLRCRLTLSCRHADMDTISTMRILAAISLLSFIPAAASAEPLAGISTEVVMLPSTKETDAVGDLAWQALVKRLGPETYTGTSYVTFGYHHFFVCGAGHKGTNTKFTFVYVAAEQKSETALFISTIDHADYLLADQRFCHPR